MRFTAEQYVNDVLSGRQVACKWVRLACERHRRDLKEGHERGLYFDRRAGAHAIIFFGVLRHSKGEWAGQRIELEPWQQFHIWVLFGWKRADGSRRFRTFYLEVARKNGKSTEMAGVGLYLLVADEESGAEIYTAATKRDQARIIHREAINMVKQSPELRREVQLMRDNISMPSTFSKYEPVGRDADSLDGLNVHAGLVDELHAHPTGAMWDILETATSSRRQPLMIAITTAGSNRQSICFQYHEYTKKVLEGVIEDDAFFGIVYSLDRVETEDGLGEGPLEDWEDERNWVKANPNLGVSKKLDNMRDKARKAGHIPARLTAFLMKELNVWVSSTSRWVLPEQWRGCGRPLPPIEQLVGRRAYGALDLSSTLDITAWVLVFEPVEEGEPWWVLPTFWIPDENWYERVKRDRVPYDAFIRGGHLLTTPGNVVDYDFIEAQIEKDADRFELAEVAFDPWNATSVSTNMINQGLEMIEFRQGFASMNPAIKALETAVPSRKIAHGNHPVLSWMADNMVVRMDPAGNKKPDKEKSAEKIDGMVALLMAYYRATLAGGAKPSVYEGRGLREI